MAHDSFEGDYELASGNSFRISQAQAAEWHTKLVEAEKEIAALRAAAEKARELAEDIDKWSKAYPTTIFPEPSPEKVDAVCKALGFRIDSISAMVLRAFTKQWGINARSALAALEEVLK